MRTSDLTLALIALAALMSAGCELAGDIFKAGFYVGVLVVALAIGVVIFLVAKLRS